MIRVQAVPEVATAIRTSGLSKRYRRVCALSDCTITVPEGRISALIGPNGAGKTTLLRLLAGLTKPTTGELTVNGGVPRQDPAFLAGIGFLAQEIPLYRRLSAEDHIRAGAHLNPCWDGESVRERLTALTIPLDCAVGTLSVWLDFYQLCCLAAWGVLFWPRARARWGAKMDSSWDELRGWIAMAMEKLTPPPGGELL